MRASLRATTGPAGLSGNLHLRHTFNDLGRNIYVRLFGDYSKDTGEVIASLRPPLQRRGVSSF